MNLKIKMKSKEAEKLVEELGKRSGFGERGRDYFVKTLIGWDNDVKENEVSYQENENLLHTLSIRRLINNGTIFHELNLPQRIALASPFYYSSDALIDDLFSREELAKIINRQEQDWSLLAKLKTSDFDNDDGRELVRVSPLLIIDSTNEYEILDITKWERGRSREYNPFSLKMIFGTLIGAKEF